MAVARREYLEFDAKAEGGVMSTLPWQPLLLALLTILVGMFMLIRPTFVHRIGYSWLRLIASELMSPSQRQDMDLLVGDPDEWVRQHRRVVNLTRLYGTAAVILGLMVIGLTFLPGMRPPGQ